MALAQHSCARFHNVYYRRKTSPFLGIREVLADATRAAPVKQAGYSLRWASWLPHEYSKNLRGLHI
jgi:hypothetical protein